MFNNSTILVTGGTGSWGIELIQQLLNFHPKKIIIYSRNENSQVELKRKINNDRLLFFIGDIRDKEALLAATKNVDFTFHLAALKHVPICEENPLESIKTNILGTQNVIDASIENNVKKVIYVSTDKAANPANIYGMTKSLGEKLIIGANIKKASTQFLCVRGGNVLGSSGSVLPLFQKQISELGEIHITDKEMIRYFISPKEAILNLLKATRISQGGEIFIMNMDAFKIIDLAEVLIQHSGRKDIKIKEIGARPGEKLKEVLIADTERGSTFILDDDLFIIAPYLKESSLAPLTEKAPPLLTKDGIRKMLEKGNFI
ncbi:polysaccharide biosynthesis protein [Viridibacillus sp. YIM B01967]|uniref:Polysaccharide biosynthesis protein n=1 Tax=Viridibacillus soli TaxID=2798301 RepID=A0ABS1H4Z3_9BACL|nr:polysaccharide biosynthesis protein [Viridibacillus soli]MBK3494482.1 polysaccharide biosynthesis protein [Viridibacillus soli]